MNNMLRDLIFFSKLMKFRIVHILAEPAELFINARQMPSMCVRVCRDVNQCGTYRNRCTQRLVILHAQTYFMRFATRSLVIAFSLNSFSFARWQRGEVILQHTVENKALHRHQTPPQYRHASPCGPLQPNVTSSTKPEVHNVLRRCQRGIEPRLQGICTKVSRRSAQRFERYARRQTDRQTDTQTG